MMGWIAGGIYKRTIGSILTAEPEQPQELSAYICVEFLDRQADQLVKWAIRSEKTIRSEADIRRQLRKSTTHTEEDIDLLLHHLKHSGRMH